MLLQLAFTQLGAIGCCLPEIGGNIRNFSPNTKQDYWTINFVEQTRFRFEDLKIIGRSAR